MVSLLGGLEACRRVFPALWLRAMASVLLAIGWIVWSGPTADILTYQCAETCLILSFIFLPQIPAAKAVALASLAKDDKNSSSSTAMAHMLSNEEVQAIDACKRIIAKSRKKFLDENNGFVPMASPAVQDYLTKAYEKFSTNLSTASSEGHAWKLTAKDDAREIAIYTANFQGSTQRWKVVATLQSNLEAAYDAVFDPSIRRKWDPMVKVGLFASMHFFACQPTHTRCLVQPGHSNAPNQRLRKERWRRPCCHVNCDGLCCWWLGVVTDTVGFRAAKDQHHGRNTHCQLLHSAAFPRVQIGPRAWLGRNGARHFPCRVGLLVDADPWPPWFSELCPCIDH